jgi:hypothetical protein
VKDSTGRVLAYVYYEEEPGRRAAANLLTKHEARRVAQYCQVAEIQDGRRGFVGVRSQHRQSERMMSAKRMFSAFGSRGCGGIDCRLEAIHQH